MGNRESFSVLHVHQDAQWLEGASLLSTDRPTLGVSAHPQLFSKDRLAKCARPYTFSCEVQLVRLGSASSSMTIAIIYRNPYPMGDFYEDLATLISSVSRLVKDYCSVETWFDLALKVIIINDMLTDTSRTAFTAMICMDLHLSKESCWKIVS